MKSKTVDLTHGSELKGIVLFALPLLCSNLLQQLYNFVDSVVVGHFAGDIALAAVGSTAAVLNLLIGFFMGIATGAGILYSMHYGAGSYEQLKRVTDAAYTLAVIAGVIISVVGLVFTPQLLALLDTPEDVIHDSTVYFRVLIAGVVFLMIYNVGAGLIRASGDSTRPLIYLLISGVANLILDLALVAWLRLGVLGASLATAISMALSAVMVVIHMMRMPEEYRFQPTKMHPTKVAIWDVIRIALPCGIQGSMFNIANLLVQAKINSFGSVAMAGITAYYKLDGFNYMPLQAVSLSCSTFTGQNIGAGDYVRVKKGIRICLILGVSVTMLMGLGTLGWSHLIVPIFTETPESQAYAFGMMAFLAPTVWCFSISDILGSALRASGAATQVTVISALCICVYRVIWLTVMMNILNDIRVVYVCYPISWILSSIVIAIYYFGFSNLRKTIKASIKLQMQ